MFKDGVSEKWAPLTGAQESEEEEEGGRGGGERIKGTYKGCCYV